MKKTILGVFIRDNPDAYNSLKITNKTLDNLFEEEMLRVVREGETRIDIQAQMVNIYKSSKFIPDDVRMKPKIFYYTYRYGRFDDGKRNFSKTRRLYNYREIQST